MGRRHFYYGLNFIAPGIAQLALGWWFRGIVQILGACLCLLGAIFESVVPIVLSARNLIYDMHSPDGEQIIQVRIKSVLLYIVILVAIWIWSYADLAINYKEAPPKEDS